MMALDGRAGAALVIGLGRYASADIPRLPFSPADADGVADLLADPEVCGFRRESVVVLKDEEARRDAIVSHIAGWLPREVAGAVGGFASARAERPAFSSPAPRRVLGCRGAVGRSGSE